MCLVSLFGPPAVMEEFDEDLSAPDRHGVLDMSHRAWAMIDQKLFNW